MTQSAQSLGTVTAVVAAIRRYLRRSAGSALGLGTFAVAGAILSLAWLLAGSEGWGQGTVVPFFLLVIGLTAVAGLLLRVLVRLRGWTTEVSLAGEMEKTASLPKGSVRAQVELARSVPDGVSPSLAHAGEMALLRRLNNRVERLAGAPGRELAKLLRRSAFGAGALALLVLLLLIVTPGRARTAWAGLTHPVALMAPAPLPPLQLVPGDAEFPRGEPPRVAVIAEGRDSVMVHWRAIGDVLQERGLPVTDGRAETLLPELEVEVRYWASSPDGAVTEPGTLVPEDPSLLADLSLEIAYPPHTRIPPETFRGVPPWLSVPEGTLISVTGRVQGEGSEVLLLGTAGRVAMRLPVEGGGFAGRWRPESSDLITWVVEGGQEGAVVPQTLDLELVPDLAPELALPEPGADGELPLSLQVPIVLEANDDYGIVWAEVETVHQRPGEEDVPVVDRISIGDLARVTLRPVLDFSEWGLRPGDAILLRARASDNAPVGHVVETAAYRLAMPAVTELREAARERIENVRSRARELMDRVSREAADLRNLERQNSLGADQTGSGADQADDFQDREELRQALEEQAEIAEQLDELSTALEEASQALAEMAENDAEDAELRERIERLEELLDEVLGPEARERLEELQDELRQGELQEAPAQLVEELSQLQEELQARLEQALEQLRRSVIEEALRAAEEEIEELVETQEGLVEELSQGEGTEAQREQAERTEDVEDRLSNLEEELSSAGDADSGIQTEAARQELTEARQAMTEAAEASQAGEREEATQQASAAQESLEAALEQLQGAQAEMAESPGEEMREGLRQGAQDALALARRQGEVRENLPTELPGDRGRLEGEEVAILEGLRNLANALGQATQDVPDLSETLSGALEESREAVTQTVEGLRRSARPQRETEESADRAQATLNRVAMIALSGLGMGGENTTSGSEAEQMGDEMGSIGAQQASLNEEANRLSEESSSGGAPAPIQLEHLVSGQQGVAARLQELGRRPGPGTTRSNLDALADESDEIAEELRRGRLDGTTLQRQEEFLQRLLSAGRTLERDGPTEEREATSAESVPRRAVTALPEELLDPLALPLPSSDELGALSPGQRRLVLDYFERVNRRRAARNGR